MGWAKVFSLYFYSTTSTLNTGLVWGEIHPTTPFKHHLFISQNYLYWRLVDNSRKAEIVKRQITEEYVVIGILEQFEDTLKLLSVVLPDYFGGALQIYRRQGRLLYSINWRSKCLSLRGRETNRFPFFAFSDFKVTLYLHFSPKIPLWGLKMTRSTFSIDF